MRGGILFQMFPRREIYLRGGYYRGRRLKRRNMVVHMLYLRQTCKLLCFVSVVRR